LSQKLQILYFINADVGLLTENMNITKNAEAVLDASDEVDLEVNTQKTKYIFMSHHQTTGQNHYIKVANKSL
jgi:hypothetical protein